MLQELLFFQPLVKGSEALGSRWHYIHIKVLRLRSTDWNHLRVHLHVHVLCSINVLL